MLWNRSNSRRLKQPVSRRCRPVVEALETRLVPAIVDWINGSGDWHDPGNWRDRSTGDNRLPGPGDHASINNVAEDITVTFAGEATVDLLTMAEHLQMNGGVLSAAGQSGIVRLSQENGATLQIYSGSMSLEFATVRGLLQAEEGTTFFLGGCGGFASDIVDLEAGAFLDGPGLFVAGGGGCGTVNVNTPLNLSQNFRVDGNLVANADTAAGANYVLQGTQAGPAPFIVPGGSTMTWGNTGGTSGLVGPGSLDIWPDGIMHIATAPLKRIQDRVVNNAGTILVSANASIQMTDGTINNLESGVYETQANENLGDFQRNVFYNAGLVRKTDGEGVSTFGIPFENTNTGRVEAALGTLVMTTGTSVGAFDVAGGAVFQLEGNRYTLGAGALLDGDGLFRLRGVLSVETDLSVPRFELSHPGGNPSLLVADSFTLTITGSLDYLRGRVEGPGRIVIAEGAVFNVAGGPSGGGKQVFNFVLDNFGTATFTEGYASNGTDVFTNQPIGTVILDGTPTINGGTMDNFGAFLKIGAGRAVLNGVALTNHGGYVGLLEGTLSVPGPGYLQADGFTEMFDGSTLQATVNLQGGYLIGSGVIDGNVTNSAWIEVGGFGATGILRVQGNYTQTSAGVLSIELGGRTPGSEHDQLVVTQQARLDGTLLITLLDGYIPDGGDGYRVLTFGSRQGDFTEVILPEGFGHGYDGTGLVITA